MMTFMASKTGSYNSTKVIPTFYLPPRLSNVAAKAVVRLLVYEDYDDCNFYRWDPVRIWQFETHQPKKKRGKKNNNEESPPLDNIALGHPPPPWKELRNLRNWWCEGSGNLLGHLVESPLRHHIISALERQSWSSHSEEEDILFLLLRLCFDTQIHFGSGSNNKIRSNWYGDLGLIIEKLGPFPIQKLAVGDDVFQGNTLILSAIIQNSPNLQILRIGQWELSNDILFSLGGHCPMLQELVIHGMEPDVFMSDDAFFKCFFSGMTPQEVLECYREGSNAKLSFQNLKYVDILFCKQTERLVQMLSYFYPCVSLSAFDACSDASQLAVPFLEVDSKMPFLRVTSRTEGLLNDKLLNLLKHLSCLKELRLHIDDKFPGADSDVRFHQELETASLKLKKIISDTKTIDALAIKPHEGVDATKVLLPTFSAQGHCLKYLYFVYDFSTLSTNSLYQLLNLCPLLEKLVIDVSLTAKNSASQAFRTELKEHPTLETLVLQDIETEFEEQDEDDELYLPVYYTLASEILKKSPNLRNLNLHLWENIEKGLEIYSRSLERLSLTLADEFCSHWITALLPSFPNLKVLSLSGGSDGIWAECLDTLSKREVRVTKKQQEFTNVFRWDNMNTKSNSSVFIMVM